MKKFKKLSCIALALTFMLALTSCGKAVTPEQAMKNMQDATQGSGIIKMSVSDNSKGSLAQVFSVSASYVFGLSKETKKQGMSMELNLDVDDNGNKVNIEGRTNIGIDMSSDLKLNLEAGISEKTLKAVGMPMEGALVITADQDSLSKMLEGTGTNLKDIFADQTKNKEENLKIISDLSKAFEGFKLEEPKKTSDSTKTIDKFSVEGTLYEYKISEANAKDIANRFMTFASTLDSKNAPTKEELADLKKSIDEEMKLNKPLDLGILVDKDGNIAYIGLSGDMSGTGNESEIGAFSFEMGLKDIDDSNDGMKYYEANKFKMYEKATVVPADNLESLLSSF